MLKICKYVKLTRSFVPLRQASFEECPPKFECRLPQPEEDDDIERMKESMKPSIFQKRHPANPKLYRNIFFFVCLPLTVCLLINKIYLQEKQKRPKFIEFSYMRIRKKEYPWDPVRTLFHNPRYNALPTGYEIEVPEDEESDPFASDK